MCIEPFNGVNLWLKEHQQVEKTLRKLAADLATQYKAGDIIVQGFHGDKISGKVQGFSFDHGRMVVHFYQDRPDGSRGNKWRTVNIISVTSIKEPPRA